MSLKLIKPLSALISFLTSTMYGFAFLLTHVICCIIHSTLNVI